MKALHTILGLALFFTATQSGQAQVARYDKTQAVGDKSFNYPTEDVQKHKTHKNKDIRIVFSDRDHNKAHATPYAQRILSEQKLGAPFYVIGEKNGFYKELLPIRAFSANQRVCLHHFIVKRTTSKMQKNSPFVGWIDKNNVLEYNHSFVSKDNNFPNFAIASVHQVFLDSPI